MSCKHLSEILTRMPPEISASLLPQVTPTPYCRLKRSPGIIGWATRCEEMPSNGPCWYWIEENGSERTDCEFLRE